MKLTLGASLLAGAIFLSAPTASSQTKPAGEPVPEDSVLFNSFKLLEKEPAYRIKMTMESNDARMAQAQAHGLGISPAETIVKGGVHQATMHMKMPAFDQPGAVDDWEIRAVVQNGRGARLISSPAAERLMRHNQQMLDMEFAMMERQAAMAMAQAAMSGPLGAVEAGMMAGATALSAVMAKRALQTEKDLFSWKCMDHVGDSQTGEKKTNRLTDLREVGDDATAGVPATAYEFYVRDGEQLQGPVRLLIAKSSGLPLRIDMVNPQMGGSVHMTYSTDNIGDIEIPSCLANSK